MGDASITPAIRDLGRFTGIAACPEGAATLAAVRLLVETTRLNPAEKTVLINTGSA